MNANGVEERNRVRKDLAKKAVALAMRSLWEEAVGVNRTIVADFPDDLEAYNRLGKALSELGRNREALEAFQHARELSPNNSIAKKNLERLSRLGDDAPSPSSRKNAPPQVFIEESGKAGVTRLIDLASGEALLKLAPGHTVRLAPGPNVVGVQGPSGEQVGSVEPRLASRLTRLIDGGNRYEATVTSVSERELTIIIREVYKHPSQAGTVSFPSRVSAEQPAYLPSALLSSELADEESEQKEPTAVKDWSDDDTEPGDDDAYSPVFHRIINASNEAADEDESL